LVLFCACKKNSPDPTGTSVQNPKVGKGQVNISGLVFDQYGAPAVNAEVTLDGNVLHTDNRGYYSYAGKLTDTDKVVIKFIKPGFFDDYKTYVLQTGAFTGIPKFFFKPESKIGTFQNSAGAKITRDKDTFTFPANAVVKQDGSAYNGEVTVVSSIVYNSFAGDARGLDNKNQKVTLEAFGSLLIKLKSATGEFLKLAKPMVIHYDMGFNAENTAPPTNKMWVYNESDNVWVESGSVVLNAGSYEGETTGLGYMQFAKSSSPTLLKASIHDAASNFPTGFLVKQLYQSVAVNSNGIALMYVPVITDKIPKSVISPFISLYSPCDEYVQSLQLPDGALPPILAQNFTVGLSKFTTAVTGRVIDCDFKGINGRAEFNFDGVIYNAAIVNGNYKVKTFGCVDFGDPVTITIYDADNKIIRPTTDFGTKGYYGKMGDISVCSRPMKAFVTINAANKSYTFSTPADKITYGNYLTTSGALETYIVALNNASEFAITAENASVGSYRIFTLDFFMPQVGRLTIFTDGYGTINFDKFKTGGIILEGTFSGKANLNGTFNKIDVSGSFKLEQ